MINFLREKIKSRKYLLLLNKYTEPSKEFSNKSRNLFIDELKNSGIIKTKPHARLLSFGRALGYSFASLIALSTLTSGVVVYAQNQSVDFNHPLYPMKRLGESIQIKLAPAEKKPVLQDEFAQRRLEEIKQLIFEKEGEINSINSQKTEEAKQIAETKDREAEQIIAEDPEAAKQIEGQKENAIKQIEEEREEEIKKIENENKTKTEELNNDFHETVKSVLETIEPVKKESDDQKKESKDQKDTEVLCNSLREKIKEHENISKENENWSDFENKCDGTKEND